MRLTRLVTSVFVALVLVLVSPAHASEITGALRPPADFPQNERTPTSARAFYWEEWNGVLAARSPQFNFVRDVAVVLVPAASSARGAIASTQTSATPPSEVTVHLTGGGIAPSTIVMRPNTLLQLLNDDDFAHSIYASDLAGFSAEPTGPHQRRTVRVTTAGRSSYELRDERVPHLRGYLHVVPDLLYVATVTEDGHFRFTDVPFATSFTMKVFYRDREVLSRVVTTNALGNIAIEPITLESSRGAQ